MDASAIDDAPDDDVLDGDALDGDGAYPESEDRRAGRAAWREAGSKADLDALAARFLEGDLAFFPGWMAEDVDEETDDLVDVLAGCCRAGFLTVASQPAAGPDVDHAGRPWRRRAFVMGFADEAAWERLALLAAEGLEVCGFPATHEASAEPAEPVAVGEMGGAPYLFAGGAAGLEELALFEEAVPAPALEDLARARFVTVLDPEWGTDARLWPALARALPGRYNPRRS